MATVIVAYASVNRLSSVVSLLLTVVLEKALPGQPLRVEIDYDEGRPPKQWPT
jgi:hypothetical protein